jgi:hypothetical protein
MWDATCPNMPSPIHASWGPSKKKKKRGGGGDSRTPTTKRNQKKTKLSFRMGEQVTAPVHKNNTGAHKTGLRKRASLLGWGNKRQKRTTKKKNKSFRV